MVLSGVFHGVLLGGSLGLTRNVVAVGRLREMLTIRGTPRPASMYLMFKLLDIMDGVEEQVIWYLGDESGGFCPLFL